MVNVVLGSSRNQENLESYAKKLANFNYVEKKLKKIHLEKEKVPAEPSYFVKNNLYQVVLNIGGFKYEIFIEKLNQIQQSRLEKIYHADSIEDINDLCDFFKPKENELYFDRDPIIFNNILNYYRSGKMHFLDNTCPLAIKDELEYWGLNEIDFEKFCSLNFYLKKENCLEEIQYQKSEDINIKQLKKKISKTNRCITNKEKIWNIVNKPETSINAKVNI